MKMATVVLVPGWFSPPRTLSKLESFLWQHGVRTINVTVPWWDPRNSLADLAEHLGERVDQLQLEAEHPAVTGNPHDAGAVHLVGHSLGGVVALLCARQLRVRSVSAIASPLQGNRVAATIGVGPIRQLHEHDNELLLSRRPASHPVLVVASHQDRVVNIDAALAGPPGCHELVGRYGSHLGVLAHPEVHAAVLAHLRAAEPTTGAEPR